MLDKPELIILDGPSSAGKTSLAKALQEELLPEIWLNFSIDHVIDAFPNSILEKCAVNDWSDVDDDLLFAGTFSCVKGLLRSGYPVIFDAVISTKQTANQTIEAFLSHTAFFIAVRCDWEEIRRRTISRVDRTLEEAEYGFKTSPRHLNYNFRVDTTKLSPEDAARRCIKAMQDLRH